MLYVLAAVAAIALTITFVAIAFGVYELIVETRLDCKVLDEADKKLHLRHLDHVNHANK